MPRNTESYTARRTEHHPEHHPDDQPDHPAEHLTDWQKQQAAERFLENLEARNPGLAHDLKLAPQDPDHIPSWLTTNREQAEYQYNCFRTAMEPLGKPERDYVATEAARIILGTIPERALSYQDQPASQVLQGEEPPEYRVSWDPKGYDAMMHHVQADLQQQLDRAQQSLNHGLGKPDHYSFADAIHDLQGLHQNILALENGSGASILDFQNKKNRSNYLAAKEARSQDLLLEYHNGITSDFPELAPKAPTADALLTDPNLTGKFQWFTQAYELLPADVHNLADAIYSQAMKDFTRNNPDQRKKAFQLYRPLRKSLLNSADPA